MKVDFLSVWDQISHCEILVDDEEALSSNQKFSFRLGSGFVGFDRKQFHLSKCLGENNKWKKETSFENCFLFETIVTFMPILSLGNEEIIVISCKTPFTEYVEELFIEGRYFYVEIYGFLEVYD